MFFSDGFYFFEEGQKPSFMNGKGNHFVIDKITNSIEEIVSGKRFNTDIIKITRKAILSIHKKMLGSLIGKRNSVIMAERYINLF